MSERPILFSTEMIRVILEGRKTQTRRVIKPQPSMKLAQSELQNTLGLWFDEHAKYWKCPYGRPGDTLWVRETFQLGTDLLDGHYSLLMESGKDEREMTIFYKADDHPNVPSWRPSIYMPRWASRITLEIAEIRVERVQEITPKDAHAEGMYKKESIPEGFMVDAFSMLWNEINLKRGYGWDLNPWVWVVNFKKI